MAGFTKDLKRQDGADTDTGASHQDVPAGPPVPTASTHAEDLFTRGEGDVNFRGVSWQGAAVLVAKFQVGLGVIGLPQTFSVLGFFPGVLCFVVLWCISTLAGYISGNARQYYPHMHNITDAAELLFGPWARELVGVFYYIYLMLTAGAGTLAISVALNALSDHGACTMAFAGVGAAIAFFVGTGFRELEKLSWLGWVGLISTFIAIWIAAGASIAQDHPAAAPPGAVKEVVAFQKTTFAEAMAAIANQLFTVGASGNYFSISAEMKHPEHFTRSLVGGQLFMGILSLATSSIIYAGVGQYLASPALGSAGVLFKKICYGITIPGLIVSAVLFSHMAAKYCFVRLLRGTHHLQHSTPTHWAVWTLSMFCTVVFGLIIIGLVPFFDDFLSLIGALINPILVFEVEGFMILFFVTRRPAKAVDRGTQPDQAMLGTGRHWLIDSLTVYKRGWKEAAGMVLGWTLILLGLLIMVGGTYGTVVVINEAYMSGEVGEMFSCADNSS